MEQGLLEYIKFMKFEYYLVRCAGIKKKYDEKI